MILWYSQSKISVTPVASLPVPFTIVPLGAFGAEIVDVDLTAIDEDVARHLKTALARFQVLLFRKQELPPEAQLALTTHFGLLEAGVGRRPEGHQVPGYRDLLRLSNATDSQTIKYGMGWHSDGLAYARTPHGATLLHCISCPPGVGDTLFASQYLAYKALSTAYRELLSDLIWHLPDIPYSEVPQGKGLAQPFIRTHPLTGTPFLFCAPACQQIVGMTRAESAGILEHVHRQQILDTGVYRHAWQKSDTVIWDNCSLLHNRADVVDVATQGLRVMHRSATAGDYEAIECAAAGE